MERFDEICRIVTGNNRVPLNTVDFALRYSEDTFKRWHKFERLALCKGFMQRMQYPDDNNLIKHKDGVYSIPIRFGSAALMREFFELDRPISMNVVPPSTCIVLDFDVDERTERTCPCRGTKQCCDECWVAVIRPTMQKLLAFCKFMGFKEYQTFFSGRRGFNVWVNTSEPVDRTAKTNLFTRLQKEWNVTVDKSVLITPNHLVKAPYMPHQTTGCLSVPIDERFLPSHAYHNTKHKDGNGEKGSKDNANNKDWVVN